MNFSLLLHTLVHLKPTQIIYQVKNRLIKPEFCLMDYSSNTCMPVWKTEPIPRPSCYDGELFTFINIPSRFTGWNDGKRGMLWAYNQNYFDFINQNNSTKESGLYWIDKFIEVLSENRVGLDPYPIALRGINWIKFFSRYPDTMTKKRLDSLYSQYSLLKKKLEYHLLGNHLLEDFYSLYIMSYFFDDKKYHKWVSTKLVDELKEEILEDGGHFEQSPMYHCILLDRLLDCINFTYSNDETELLKRYAERMLGWLESFCYKDGSFAMLNDSALGIAPSSSQLFDYAKRLGISWDKAKLGDSGYRKLVNDRIEVITDCGEITAGYQPGHSHADVLNYELRIDGKTIVTDTGISTYNKTERRQYERSTIAHNCICVGNNNSDEVWGGFRVGRRCKVKIYTDESELVEASHNGFGKECRRIYKLSDNSFTITDMYEGDAVSYIHLAENVSPERVKIEGAKRIEITDTEYSVEYNKFIKNKTIAIYFNGEVEYTIF